MFPRFLDSVSIPSDFESSSRRQSHLISYHYPPPSWSVILLHASAFVFYRLQQHPGAHPSDPSFSPAFPSCIARHILFCAVPRTTYTLADFLVWTDVAVSFLFFFLHLFFSPSPCKPREPRSPRSRNSRGRFPCGELRSSPWGTCSLLKHFSSSRNSASVRIPRQDKTRQDSNFLFLFSSLGESVTPLATIFSPGRCGSLSWRRNPPVSKIVNLDV